MDFLFRWPCGTTMPPCLRCDHSPAPGHTCIRDWFGRPYRWPLPLLEPAERFRVVLTHPLTLKKKNSEIVVRARKTLFGRCPQPTQRCPVVRGRSPAVGIHHGQIDLGGRIPSLRCLLEPLQRFLFAAVRPNRQDGSDSQLVLLKGRPPFVSGFRPVLRFSNRAVRS